MLPGSLPSHPPVVHDSAVLPGSSASQIELLVPSPEEDNVLPVELQNATLDINDYVLVPSAEENVNDAVPVSGRDEPVEELITGTLGTNSFALYTCVIPVNSDLTMPPNQTPLRTRHRVQRLVVLPVPCTPLTNSSHCGEVG